MKRTILLLLLVSLFISGCAQPDTGFEQKAEASGLELAQDWKVLSALALFTSVILVAIAYAIGIGFEMPEIKAWAGNELSQVVANAVIIIVLIVAIGFIEALVAGMVFGSGLSIPECGGNGGSCLQAVTTQYLEDYVDAAKDGAHSTLQNNVDAAGMAARRLGLYCLTIFCLQIGYTTTIAGNYAVDVDFYSIVFEYYTNLLASMEAQLFFVNYVSFGMAPILLAIGVVGRSFFFTRKLGGLLIAVAVGTMFFFPGMYLFDWVTLDTALTGDKSMGDEEFTCPEECGYSAPIAYLGGTDVKYNSINDVYAQFPESPETADDIIKGYETSAVGVNGTVYSCQRPKVPHFDDEDTCPVVCRELPYPSSVPICADLDAQSACAVLPEECKVRRYVTDINQTEYAMCPDSCKVVPPLKSDCLTDMGLCLASSPDCRMTYHGNTGWRPTKETEDLLIKLKCSWAAACQASYDAEQSCVWIVPQSGSCDTLCMGCPAHCRVIGGDLGQMTSDCTSAAAACALCAQNADSCNVVKSNIEALPGADDCSACPAERRIITSSLPAPYKTGGCAPESCPLDSDHRLRIPRNTCETCLFTEESYAYNPPIQARCADLCKPPETAPVKDAGSYMNIGGEGLVGREEIKNVAKLMVPAYVLPLFNIVATLVFIKGLSGMLGGDIEIPGISKVF